jgi:hypothetical protein
MALLPVEVAADEASQPGRRLVRVVHTPAPGRAWVVEQTRAQVLDAALAVFLRRGFHGASLDEIAEEAGYTTGAVYSVATWAGRWGVELALPAREVVRGIYAISRGLGLGTLLADEPRALDQFEEMFLTYVTGLIRTRPGAAAPAKGRQP